MNEQNIRVESPAERRARWLSVSVSPSATPTRGQGQDALSIKRTENAWERDMPAYKRLRADGTQPKSIDGCAELEARASSRDEITMGHIFSKDQLPKVREGMQMAKELGYGDG